MIDYQSGFACLAEAFARNALPADIANWDIWQPPEHDATIAEILDQLDESTEVVPEAVCKLLNVPSGTTYALGTERIWAFIGSATEGNVSSKV